MEGLKQSAGAARRLARMAADLVLPPTCPGCRAAVADADALCARCWAAIRFIEPPLCPVYGTPFSVDLGEGIVSAEALADPPPFRRARSAALYGDVARRLVQQLKYHDRPDMAEVMAMTMRRAGRDLLEGSEACALIVPVPLHHRRLWQRKFNQAAILADRLSKLAGIPFDPFVLKRVTHTGQQVGLTAGQRVENVRGAFRVPEAMQLRIARLPVLLVDDVYTSGATAKAAARALLRGGAASVDVLTFARVAA
jgi:ComF family protein